MFYLAGHGKTAIYVDFVPADFIFM